MMEMPNPATRVLIAGVSTRAIAESAARAGFNVVTLDAFADRDQHPNVRALSLPRDFGSRFTAPAAARISRGIECDAVVYLSSFENHPRAVATLTRSRALWGNPPSVLERVRDPRLVEAAIRRRGLAAASIVDTDSAPRTGGSIAREPSRSARLSRVTAATDRRWLLKPLKSGGGRGVRSWRAGSSIPRGYYVQEQVDGVPGSIVFVAAGGCAVPLGVSRQLIGDPAFGASGYKYCGSILVSLKDDPHGDELLTAASALARAVTEEFRLVGVNGIDFIARGGVPCAIEVNPRWSASVDLIERAHGVSVFDAHAAACTTGRLPRFDLDEARTSRRLLEVPAGWSLDEPLPSRSLVDARGSRRAIGKAIVLARRDVVIGDTRSWCSRGADASVRDVPWPGERVHAGQPVCTVFAAGRDAAACYASLVRRANRVYGQLAEWEREVA